jgi:hypothetical protein
LELCLPAYRLFVGLTAFDEYEPRGCQQHEYGGRDPHDKKYGEKLHSKPI